MDRAFFESHGVVQLEAETDKAFSAFCAYLELPRDTRSLRMLAESTDISKNSAGRWSRQHGWRDRTQVFDAEVTNVLLQQLLDRRLHEVLTSVESSIEDAKAFRKHTMQMLRSVRVPSDLLSLQQARIDNDSWQMQILEIVNALGGTHAESETA